MLTTQETKTDDAQEQRESIDRNLAIRAVETLAQVIDRDRRMMRWNIGFRTIKYLTAIGIILLLIFQFKDRDYSMPFAPDFRTSPWQSILQTGEQSVPGRKHLALVRLEGIINSDNRSLSAGKLIIESLDKAFRSPETEAVVLMINSPGGSPVVSGQIYQKIRQLQDEFPNRKLHALIGEGGLSGGYYVAAAADKIYADPASLVGSIGVISSGFGMTGMLEKLGLQRRVYTSGDNKAFLDPFLPEKPEEVSFWQTALDEIHRQFIERVKTGRGDRLNGTDELLFNGLFWTGSQALELGLVDGLESYESLTRKLGGLPVVDFTQFPEFADLVLSRFATVLGRALAENLTHSAIIPR